MIGGICIGRLPRSKRLAYGLQLASVDLHERHLHGTGVHRLAPAERDDVVARWPRDELDARGAAGPRHVLHEGDDVEAAGVPAGEPLSPERDARGIADNDVVA